MKAPTTKTVDMKNVKLAKREGRVSIYRPVIEKLRGLKVGKGELVSPQNGEKPRVLQQRITSLLNNHEAHPAGHRFSVRLDEAKKSVVVFLVKREKIKRKAPKPGSARPGRKPKTERSAKAAKPASKKSKAPTKK